jgi:hypothetical protein
MNARIRHTRVVAAAAAILLGSASCGDVNRQGRSPSILIIDSLTAASGAASGQFGGFLLSDVVTVKSSVATIFDDLGKATLRTTLKDLGSPALEATPTALNAIMLTWYHVFFHRADGRNTQGVDVPYAFDGAVTATITATTVDVGFELVRSSAKMEAPLLALRNLGGRLEIETIADVTFYGRDLAGNDVQATGSITVNFADFADPSS